MTKLDNLFDNWAHDNLDSTYDNMYEQCKLAYIAGYEQRSEEVREWLD